MSAEYAFESFLPYRQALQLGRATQGLLRLEIGLRRGCGAFDETLVSGIAANARGLFPDIRPPELSEEKFQEARERENLESTMTEAEMDAYVERMAQDLRESIEAGEIDIWDDSPRFVETCRVVEFCSSFLDRLTSSMVPSLKPGAGLLGDLVRESANNLKTAPQERIRALRAGLAAWDFARMHHEGEPPYRIAFSSQVAEVLGIDPAMEKIRAVSMPRPTSRDRRRIKAALTVLGKGAPEFLESLRGALVMAGVLRG